MEPICYQFAIGLVQIVNNIESVVIIQQLTFIGEQKCKVKSPIATDCTQRHTLTQINCSALTICVYKLGSNYWQTFNSLSENDSSQLDHKCFDTGCFLPM